MDGTKTRRTTIRRPSAALVVATIALFVALGGTAGAAVTAAVPVAKRALVSDNAKLGGRSPQQLVARAAQVPRLSAYGHHPLSASEQRRLRASAWLGGTFTAATGEAVRVSVSEDYPDTLAVAQRWADFIASLLHGSELARVHVYVLTPDEMRLFCGPRALGCYGGNELAFMGETVADVTPEEVAAHEYGHHVAANRLNPPWLTVDWGPKRWASAANICSRQLRGEVYPGNESDHYELNPGEGFAEVYRVLNELEHGATAFSWPLVDPTFSPDAAALEAAKQDVVGPWTTPVTTTARARFTANGKKVWKLTVPTLLDGKIAITLSFPRGSLHELTLLDSAGNVLAQGLWSGLAEKRLTTTVCGQRSLVLRVTRKGIPGRFSLRVTHD